MCVSVCDFILYMRKEEVIHSSMIKKYTEKKKVLSALANYNYSSNQSIEQPVALKYNREE